MTKRQKEKVSGYMVLVYRTVMSVSAVVLPPLVGLLWSELRTINTLLHQHETNITLLHQVDAIQVLPAIAENTEDIEALERDFGSLELRVNTHQVQGINRAHGP